MNRIDLPGLLTRYADLGVGVGLLCVLVLLIVPIPPFILDLFISVSFTTSFVMLAATIYAAKPAELSSFPSLLLVTTLLRLSLAIASTKMILLDAHAGQIISAFGQLVVGGNVAVGIVVFVVLSVIQFIVVAKGADRVAEVSARFTLDGIPGRQMSIDADLRSGQITPTDARRLRAELERETYFYGSLDGAMKFVKGDSIAGLVVALVNIVGGLTIGIGQRGMSFGDALNTYTILTVGDGLVSQIPSLVVSISAGLLVTRVSSNSGSTNLGRDIFQQLSLHPAALMMAGVACLALAVIPGFPHIQFVLAGGVQIGLAVVTSRQRAAATRLERPQMPAMTRDGGTYVQRILDDVELGTSSPLRARLGVKACDSLHPVELNRRFALMRRDLMVRLGVPFPGVGLLRDPNLDEDRYIFDIDDVSFYGGTLIAGHVLVSGDASLVTMDGVPGYHPRAEKSVWVTEQAATAIDDARIMKSSTDAALCDHLIDVCEQHASSFIGTQETRFLLDQLSIEFRELVNQIQQVITTVQLGCVLRSLLDQRIPIRNLRGILEAILRIPDGGRSLDRMVREARIALGQQVVRPLADLNNWVINAAVLDPAWEAVLEAQIEVGPDGEPQCVLDADQLEILHEAFATQGDTARLVVTTALLRPHLARILRTLGIRTDVLAMEEIPLDTYRVHVIATLEPA
ncbi:flagellar biosynthesis protein FlhA [Paraburkholderia adhaesiva]|uniref:flagellar biosynthesis protein FlhA n=1 Tax=Paraburkholderia adhaesiva TaxID=2883244 RepID=UPI001F440DE4|nr:flagellar biosynthesis protein FlhA [Paraburkholderia adhaesiva]